MNFKLVILLSVAAIGMTTAAAVGLEAGTTPLLNRRQGYEDPCIKDPNAIGCPGRVDPYASFNACIARCYKGGRSLKTCDDFCNACEKHPGKMKGC